MKLQVNYVCDICEKSFLIDFHKSLLEKKLICPNCHVIYKFTEKELQQFKDCYINLLDGLRKSEKEK